MQRNGDYFTIYQTSPTTRDISNSLTIGEPWHDGDFEAALMKKNKGEIEAIFYNSGLIITVKVQKYCEGFYINLELRFPRNSNLEVRGLFGDLNGDVSNDFMTRDGTRVTVLPSRCPGIQSLYEEQCM